MFFTRCTQLMSWIHFFFKEKVDKNTSVEKSQGLCETESFLIWLNQKLFGKNVFHFHPRMNWGRVIFLFGRGRNLANVDLLSSFEKGKLSMICCGLWEGTAEAAWIFYSAWDTLKQVSILLKPFQLSPCTTVLTAHCSSHRCQRVRPRP